jgi:hypothetical protein
MPFQPIQPVRPRRPQVGSAGQAAAVTPVSQLPRGPIVARGILRVAVGVAVLLPAPKRAPVVVTRPARPTIVARQAPQIVSVRQPVILRLPNKTLAVVTRPVRTVIVARQIPPVSAVRQPVVSKAPKRARPTARLVSVARILPPAQRGSAGVLRVPPRAVPVVITRLLFRPLIAVVKPPIQRGVARVLPMPYPRVRGEFTVSYVDTPPVIGLIYQYRWRTTNGFSASAYGPVVSAATSTIPAQVQNLTATPAAGQVVLSADPIAYALTYAIYWSMTPGAGASLLIAGLSAPLFVVDPPDTLPRYYTMTASNYCGQGPKSAEVSASSLPPVGGGGAGCAGGSTGGANCSGTTWTGNS